MSVLIKGLKKPKNCWACVFNDADCCCRITHGEIDRDDYSCDVDCPIIDIPTPHGRLIDGDELKTAFPRMDNSTDIKIHSVRATINRMPTIIESEE